MSDINDLECVDILALSGKINEKELVEILKNNPLDNDDQQTPIVVLKRIKTHTHKKEAFKWKTPFKGSASILKT